MTPLRTAMIKAMQVRGFSPRTHKSYLAAVTDLARYCKRSPAELEVKDLRSYFEHLAVGRGLAPASCRLAFEWDPLLVSGGARTGEFRRTDSGT